MRINITTEELATRVVAFATTKEGKERILTAFADRNTNSGSSISGMTEELIDEYVKKLLYYIDIELQEYMVYSDSGEQFISKDDITVSTPKKKGDGSVVLNLCFENVSRDSLGQGDWNDDAGGINNIVALFNNGYKANDYAYGWWDGHTNSNDSRNSDSFAWARSRKERPKLNFLQHAISEFNNKYSSKGVLAKLGSIYEN